MLGEVKVWRMRDGNDDASERGKARWTTKGKVKVAWA
jgi:hypothetical protein